MRSLTALLRRWLEETGSTRGPAVIRVGLAFILWLTWGDDFTLFQLRTTEMFLVAGAFYAATGAMLVGFCARFSTALAGLVSAYIYYKLGVLDGVDRFVHHHTALLVFATLILSLTPCGHSLSVDRFLAVRRGNAAKESGPMWAVRLLALLVSVVYFGGAVSKTNMGWLSGDRLEQIFVHFYGDSSLTSSSLPSLVFLLATVGVVILEYALTFGLWWQRARRLLVPAGILMHVSFYVLLPVETFSLTMLTLYVAFAPNAVDAVPRIFAVEPKTEKQTAKTKKKRTSRRRKLARSRS